MAGNYGGEASMINPVSTGGLGSDKCAGIIVIGALAMLILIRRGFRGVSVGRVTGGLVRG